MPAKPIPKVNVKSGGAVSRIRALDRVAWAGEKFLIYGHSGTGKTRLFSTFSTLGRTLHVICSGNKTNEALSIRGTRNVDVVELEHPDELKDLKVYAEAKEYAVLGLDHVTEFSNMVLAKIIGLERMPEQSSWGLAKQQDYQAMGLQVKEYLREFIDFSGRVVIIGQQRTYDATEEAGSDDPVMPYVSVATTPAVAGWLAPTCDYIVQTFKKRETLRVSKKLGSTIKEVVTKGATRFYARTGPHPIYMTKFRVPPGVELPDEIVDPSYTKFAELIDP